MKIDLSEKLKIGMIAINIMIAMGILYLQVHYATKEDIKEIKKDVADIKETQIQMQADVRIVTATGDNRSALLVQHDHELKDLEKRTTILEIRIK